MSADEVLAFLAHRPVAGRVAASTQCAIGGERYLSKAMCLERRMVIGFCGQSFEAPRIYWRGLRWIEVAGEVARKGWCYRSSLNRVG